MTNLSPAAQAVLQAYKQGGLNAALEAAAKQIEPTLEERKTDPSRRGPGFFNGISCGAAQLRAIAAELDNA